MIVLIADIIDSHKNENLFSDKLELVEKEYFNEVYNALKKISSVIVYNSVSDFQDNISKHIHDTIFSIWSGTASRNRRAFLPAICEAHNMKYVGADTYTNILCQDKSLAKEYCRRFGLKTPNYFLYNGINSIDNILQLSLPLIVKPNFEGGSIGISTNNIFYNYLDAKTLCEKLFDVFGEIIIEEFTGGKEICFILSGNKNNIEIVQGVEIYNPEDSSFFDSEIFGYEVKKHSKVKIEQRRFTPKDLNLITQLENIFISLGKVEAIRIDGKYIDDNFYMIELSPDIHYGKTASFATAHKINGIEYNAMIKKLIDNASKK